MRTSPKAMPGRPRSRPTTFTIPWSREPCRKSMVGIFTHSRVLLTLPLTRKDDVYFANNFQLSTIWHVSPSLHIKFHRRHCTTISIVSKQRPSFSFKTSWTRSAAASALRTSTTFWRGARRCWQKSRGTTSERTKRKPETNWNEPPTVSRRKIFGKF